jgi:hypothetical protein
VQDAGRSGAGTGDPIGGTAMMISKVIKEIIVPIGSVRFELIRMFADRSQFGLCVGMFGRVFWIAIEIQIGRQILALQVRREELRTSPGPAPERR